MQPILQPRRPTAVTVIAVLQFVFGGLGVCGGVFLVSGANEMIANLAPKTPGIVSQQEIQALTEAKVPYYQWTVKGDAGLSVALSALMIASGVGLLQMRKWGRTSALAYGGLSILLKIIGIIYNVVVVIPAMYEVCDAIAAKGGQNIGVAQITRTMLPLSIGGIVGAMIYPAVVLIVLLQPSVAAAFRGEGVGQGGPGDLPDPNRGDPGDPGYGQQPPPGYDDDPGYRQAPEDRFGPPR